MKGTFIRGSEHYQFGRALYEICKSPSHPETVVDDLTPVLLDFGEFYRDPLYYRQKPKLEFDLNGLRFVSVPDYAIYRTLSNYVPAPEIVGVVKENKPKVTNSTGMGQETGSALASCLHNCLHSERNMPIAVIRGRSIFIIYGCFII